MQAVWGYAVALEGYSDRGFVIQLLHGELPLILDRIFASSPKRSQTSIGYL
ncbi:MAG: hypothetical protein V7K21_25855 [Nostoc sp.]|uniref:hypothetical protein n=1 Tax=Nostoc sp. TaxID=1180 RepID=UPI002FF7F349